MLKTLIFHTNYLGNPTPRRFGYSEEGEDTPKKRWWQWKQHYARYNKVVKCFHDGDLVMDDEEIYTDEDIIWGSGDRIGRIKQDNWAGLRINFARGLRWGLERGFDIFAYIESDCFTRTKHDKRIAEFLSGHDLGAHDLINDANICNGTALMIMGRIAACQMVDYFMLARHQFADDPNEIFETQVGRVPDINRRCILRGWRVEGESLESGPKDAEFVGQISRFSKAQRYIYG